MHDHTDDWEDFRLRCRYRTWKDVAEALGISNGTFYRRRQKAPTRIVRLAMAAILNRLPPFGAK